MINGVLLKVHNHFMTQTCHVLRMNENVMYLSEDAYPNENSYKPSGTPGHFQKTIQRH